jgi:hypothetical protein
MFKNLLNIICFLRNGFGCTCHVHRVSDMVFSATFNIISVISWRSALLVKEIGIPGENHRPTASHWQTLSHNVVIEYTSLIAGFEHTTLVIGTDCIGSCKSNHHTNTTTTTPVPYIIVSIPESVSDCCLNTNWTVFQYHSQDKLHVEEMMYVLY